jgi:ABC-2 type transport system permease protein
MNALAYHLGYEFKAGIRDKSHVFMNYLFPLAFFLLVGGFMTRMDPGFSGRMLPSMAIFAVMCSFLLSLPGGLVAARDSGTLRSYRISGVPSWAALAVPTVAGLAHMALATALIASFSTLVFRAPMPAEPLVFALAWLCMAASIAGLGALIGVVSGNGRAATLLAQCVYLPSIILGGLMTPPGVLPPALERLSLLFPAKHAMLAFAAGSVRAAALPLTALAAGTIISFVLAAKLFAWDGASAPRGKRILALLALVPYAATMLIA